MENTNTKGTFSRTWANAKLLTTLTSGALQTTFNTVNDTIEAETKIENKHFRKVMDAAKKDSATIAGAFWATHTANAGGELVREGLEAVISSVTLTVDIDSLSKAELTLVNKKVAVLKKAMPDLSDNELFDLAYNALKDAIAAARTA